MTVAFPWPHGMPQDPYQMITSAVFCGSWSTKDVNVSADLTHLRSRARMRSRLGASFSFCAICRCRWCAEELSSKSRSHKPTFSVGHFHTRFTSTEFPLKSYQQLRSPGLKMWRLTLLRRAVRRVGPQRRSLQSLRTM